MNSSDSFVVGKALAALDNTDQQAPQPYEAQPRHEQSAQGHPAYVQKPQTSASPTLLQGIAVASTRYNLIKDEILPRSKLPPETKKTLTAVLDFCEQEQYAPAIVSAILTCIEIQLYPILNKLENILAKHHIENANAVFTTLIEEIAITMLVATRTLEHISPQNTANAHDKDMGTPITIPLAASSLLVSMLSPPSTVERLVETAKNGQIDWRDFAKQTGDFVTEKLNELYGNPAPAPQPSTSAQI
jgi:hypothetical protein